MGYAYNKQIRFRFLTFFAVPCLIKNNLTKAVNVHYNSNVVTLGAWCNGNTWVSKTFVEGSNPSAPAKSESLETVEFQGSHSWQASIMPIPDYTNHL